VTSAAAQLPTGVYLRSCLAPFEWALARPDVTDIYVNRPGELWIETLGGAIERHDDPSLNELTLARLARQVAALTHQGVSRDATSMAIIAVACFGLMLLSGRLSKRRGTQLILGCFIVFGAPSIAAGMMNALGIPDTTEQKAQLAASVPLLPVSTPPPVAAANSDPYAGAALPPRR
jgi:hypothetical protein